MIRVKVGDTVFEVDGVEEAVQLHRQLSTPSPLATRKRRARQEVASSEQGNNNGTVLDRMVTTGKIAMFVTSLNENGERVVTALLDSPNGMTTDDLARVAKISTYSLPPVIRHIRVTARRAHLDADQLIEREQINEEGKPKSRYRIHQDSVGALRDAMKE